MELSYLNTGYHWRKLLLLTSLLILLGMASVAGQSDRLLVDRLGSLEGFSTNHITCSFQDDDGYMWFGTYAGLNRYDGYEVKVYKPDPQDPKSISGLQIFSIVDDQAGNLWIGTTGNGLNYYDRSTNQFTLFDHDPKDDSSLPSSTIEAMHTDGLGRLWIATDKGLVVLKKFEQGDKPVFEKVVVDKDSDDLHVHSIFEDGMGNVWVSMNKSIYRIAKDDVTKVRKISMRDLVQGNVETICQLASGELLLGGANGLYIQRSPGEEDFVRVGLLTGISVMAYERELDQLIIGASSGLYIYSVSRNGSVPERISHFTHDPLDRRSLSNNDITTLLIDATGIVWAGTSGGGVNKFDPRRKNFYHHKGGEANLPVATIRALYRDSENRIWVGSDGGGVEVTDGLIPPYKKPDFKHYTQPNRTYAILEVNNDLEHAMYFGSNSGAGLWRMELGTPNQPIVPIQETHNSVFALLQDSRGLLWVGSYFKGLQRWAPEAEGYKKVRIGHEKAPSLPSQIIRSLAEDAGGNIWVGTADGLAMIPAEQAVLAEPKIRIFRNKLGDEQSLINDYILPILVSKNGTVWVGTYGGGISRYLPATEGGPARFKNYGEAEGLINGVIKSIIEDHNGMLWISSNHGLSRFDPRSELFENFNVSDGLQSDEFGELAACIQSDGSIIFGGVNGLTAFYPDAIKLNVSPARPVITGISILNTPIEVGESYDGDVILPRSISDLDQLELSHRQNSISLKLGALHYSAPDQNAIAYQLQGFDEEWVHTTAKQRVATYTNLPSGAYTFLLKVSNNDEVWNEEVLSLGITITPPFWRTNFAYLIYGLLFLGMLYLIRRYSIVNIEEKNQIELKKLDQEKIEELNQLKLQLFTNISHEFRTPLTLISGPLEALIRNQSTIKPEQRSQYYHLMYKNSKYLLRLINELLDFRKLEQGKLSLSVSKNDIVAYIEETVAPFEFLATKKDITFRVDAEERPITTWFSSEVLEKTIFNLLSNAFKFTPQGGTITVTVGKTSGKDPRFKKHLPSLNTILISVKDSGAGIPANKVNRIFDRFYKVDQEKSDNIREGTGIGLAYTKSLIDLHHGLIDVESRVGEGTTFHLRLPIDKSAYTKSEVNQVDLTNYVPQADPVDYFMPEENNKEEEMNALHLQGNYSINKEDGEVSPLLLYIDDNADLRNYIRQSFANNFRIIAADSGEAGLELAITSLPDIVISDVMMPGIDGVEVLDRLKSNPQTSHIPVILLTAKDSEETRLQGLRYGADGYVTKPFKEEVLLQQIINIVQRRDILRDRFRREVITEPADITVTDSDEVFLRQAMDIVEENMSNTEFSVEQLVKEMSVSRSKLYLKLKALTGQSSSEFVRTVRLKRAVQLLEESNYSVKEVMYMTGFNTASYFSKCFKRQFGIVPSEYVRLNKQSAKK